MTNFVPGKPPVTDRRRYEARYKVHGQEWVSTFFAGSEYEVWLIVKNAYPTALVTAIMALTTF
jgi:hypothetical protein